MNAMFDIAIVGSGFGGSLLAMIARRLGHSVVLLEKGRHPRFAIGESSTPLANLLLEELATRYNLPRLLPLTKWGSWQRSYPQIGCGLKRGFTFYHHEFDQPFVSDATRHNQLLVAASPHDEIADTHWYRPDFDHFLVREAQQLGVKYFDRVSLTCPVFSDDGVVLQGQWHDEPLTIRARFLVDATGPRGFLHRALLLCEKPFEKLPATQALYTHFTGVRPVAGTTLDVNGETPPYPVDDAAVHHVFDGGWIWVLRFNNGITSAGIAATDNLAKTLNLEEGQPAWDRLLKRLPTVSKQFGEAMPRLPWMHAQRLSFRSEKLVGPRWALLPSSAGFVDPLLSTGFPLTLLGIGRLGEAIADDWDSTRFLDGLELYQTQTFDDLGAAEDLIAALYACMDNFEVFSALSLLYFAAASYSETARRLGRPQLADSFLLHKHPNFGPQLHACCEWAKDLNPVHAKELIRKVHNVIKPFDVAGLTDRDRRNWYPANAADLLHAASKLQASQDDIQQLLKRCGFNG